MKKQMGKENVKLLEDISAEVSLGHKSHMKFHGM
jgi:hypothetical protein